MRPKPTTPEATDVITSADLERMWPSNHAYYGEGGRYGRAWLVPQEFPRLFADPDYYNLPARLAGLQAGESAVDILCGNCVPGMLSVALARAHPQATVIGLDPSQRLLDTCRANFEAMGLTNGQWVLSDDEQLGIPDASVDVIVNRLGFHHIADIPHAMSEYRRVLRPGGRVIVLDFTIPDDDIDADDFINGIYLARDKTHIKIRSLKEAQQGLGEAGFQVQEVLPWSVTHVTTEFGFATPESKAAYQASYRAGSQHARDVHRVSDRDDGELTFTHPAMVLAAVKQN
jgi:ubiquinone/menaquinone biosynthesis C-methylase UbiE